jgi:hypothetical protein
MNRTMTDHIDRTILNHIDRTTINHIDCGMIYVIDRGMIYDHLWYDQCDRSWYDQCDPARCTPKFRAIFEENDFRWRRFLPKRLQIEPFLKENGSNQLQI